MAQLGDIVCHPSSLSNIPVLIILQGESLMKLHDFDSEINQRAVELEQRVQRLHQSWLQNRGVINTPKPSIQKVNKPSLLRRLFKI